MTFKSRDGNVIVLFQSRKDDLETEYSKLQDEINKLNEDNKLVLEQNQQEYQATKQQCENDIAKLRGELGVLILRGRK